MRVAQASTHLLVIIVCWIASSEHLFAQRERVPSRPSGIALAKRAQLLTDEGDHQKPRDRIFVQFSAGPAAISPTGAFYDGLDSNVGIAFNVRLYQSKSDGETKGFFGGISYQRAVFKYGEMYSFAFQQTQLTGAVHTSVWALEAGRAYPTDKNGSHLYVIAGLASLQHQGDSPASNGSALGYEAGTRLGLRIKGGFAVCLSRNFGVDFGMGFDVMRTRVTYTDLNNYSEIKNDGVLLAAAMGLLYRL